MKIGFILCSAEAAPLPSTRIAVLNILPQLRMAGLEPCILFGPETPTETPELSGVAEEAIRLGCKIVVFQKVSGADALACASTLSKAGVRTLFAVCDRVDVPMAAATDATVVISDFLRSLYPADLQARIHVVHDGIEQPHICKDDWGERSSPLRAVLVTSHTLDHLPVIEDVPAWLNVRIVGKYKKGLAKLKPIYWTWSKLPEEERPRYVRFLMNRHIACVPWGPESVYREIVRADVGIIPVAAKTELDADGLPPEWMRKSENRLTLKMSAGLPVIATPIPSYEAVIEHGRNGFFARTPRDWATCLQALRDPGLRREVGQGARASVARKYSMQEQASKFLAVLRQIGASEMPAFRTDPPSAWPRQASLKAAPV